MPEIIIAKRKISTQGKTSYTIVLPKEFCENNKWLPGKELILKTDGKRLILEPSE